MPTYTPVLENLDYSINPGGTILFAATLVALCGSLAVFALRIYVKACISRKLTPDDWWMMAGQVGYIPYLVICAYGPAVAGTGRWTSELTEDGIELALWCWAICEVIYPPVSFCIRMSIAWFLLRLAVIPWHKRVIKLVMWANGVVSFGWMIILCVQCIPLSYFWTRQEGAKGYCVDKAVVPVSTIVHAVLGALLDWVLAFLPIAMLWSVRINQRTKIAIATVLGLGAFCGISLLVRIPFLKIIEVSADFLHATTGIATVAIIEPGIGIIAGSLVTLQPLLKRFKLGFSTGSSAQSGQRRGPSGAVPSAGRCVNCVVGSGGGGGDASHSASTSGHHNHDSTYKGDTGSGSGSGSKSPTVMSWEERRYSARGDKHGLFGQGGGRKQGRGYSIQLSTLLSGTQSTHAGASRLSSSGSEEELRRGDKFTQQQQREREQRETEAETRAVSGGGAGTIGQAVGASVHREQHIHDGGFHGKGDSTEWEVEVTASPRGHGDEESGLAGYGSRAGSGILGAGIAVQRDIQVVSMRVDERR